MLTRSQYRINVAHHRSMVALKKGKFCSKCCAFFAKIGWKRVEDYFDIRWRAYMAESLVLTNFILTLKEGRLKTGS